MKLIDLTLTISQNILTFPGSPQPHFIPWSTIKKDGYNLELLFLSSHTGTHLDAPIHFAENSLQIHKIPIRRLVTKALLIKLKKEDNKSITKSDIIKFEKKHGVIPPNSTIVFLTGWQKYLNEKHYFTHNPGLSTPAANYLVSKKTSLVGIDSPSIDLGKNKKFPVHRILSKNNILIVENLCNLDKLSKTIFDFIVLPLKLKDATGSPIRAIAIQ